MVPSDDIENTADDVRAQGALSERPVHGIPSNADDSFMTDPCDISLRIIMIHDRIFPFAVSTENLESHQRNTVKVENKKRGMILPFTPLTMTFHNVNYYVDMPKVYNSI